MEPLFKIATMVWVFTGVYWILAAFNIKAAQKKEDIKFRIFYMLFWIVPFLLTFFRVFPQALLYTRLYPAYVALEYTAFIGMLLGLGLMIWSRVALGRNWSGRIAIKEDHQLITTGPYAVARHPMYTGFIIAFFCTAILLGEVRGVLAFLILIVGILMKIQLEEKFVKQVFGHHYMIYSKKVKRLIPFIY
ncbi:MAG TPA: isoprenylcysteine carboxylmethyltransferase family protein [Cytophagales bacterium]|nr:isoprenylcysteine carboxylmethyltransferase family protein [Cytophagales bacterium]